MEHSHDNPQSFHASPAEATRAPAEEFLYLACLHEGTGVGEPDFLAVVGGGMHLDPDFHLDLHPARAHEVRLQGGDSTTEIFQ